MRMTKLANADAKTGGTSIKIISRNERGCRDGKLVKMMATRHCHYCSDSK